MLALFVFTMVGTGQSVCSPVDRSGSASDVPRAASTRKGSWRWGNRVSESLREGPRTVRGWSGHTVRRVGDHGCQVSDAA